MLIGHGSARYADAGRLLGLHADALRAGGAFAEVSFGLLNGAPSVADALARTTAATVHVVPFFMEDGWFARIAVPRALDLDHATRGRTVRCHAPVGTHDGMAGLAAVRIARYYGETGLNEAGLTVVLVGHGSARAPGQPMALHRHVRRLAATGRYARVEAAFLEEPPLLPDQLAALADIPVAVVGFFAGEGFHVRDQLPMVLADARAAGQVVHDLGSIADEPGIRDIILDRVMAAG
ncbi:MAG TPA: CbiX/SirB N-terminal domain-containing protein [Acetobacteraceae bacterium]